MATFLALAFSFPTVVFTTLMLVMLAYWVLVFVGALGFDFGGADGALDAKTGALEAKMGVLEAKAGLLEAKAGLLDAKAGALEGAIGAKAAALEAKAAVLDAKAAALEAKAGALDAKAGALEAKGGLLQMLGFGVVPATVAFSVLTFWCWLTSMAGAALLGPVLGGFLPVWVSGTLVLLLALGASFPLAGVSVVPLKPLFSVKLAPRRRQLLGKVATVTSGRVDATFGQATLEDGGAGLILSIICPRENGLKREDRVLLLEYNEDKAAYEVEPVDWLLPEEIRQLDSPAAAEVIARAHARQRIGR